MVAGEAAARVSTEPPRWHSPVSISKHRRTLRLYSPLPTRISNLCSQKHGGMRQPLQVVCPEVTIRSAQPPQPPCAYKRPRHAQSRPRNAPTNGPAGASTR